MNIVKKTSRLISLFMIASVLAFAPTVTNIENLPKAEASTINSCAWGYSPHQATNQSCYHVRHVVVTSDGASHVTQWVNSGYSVLNNGYSNEAAYGIDVWVASPEPNYYRTLSYY